MPAGAYFQFITITMWGWSSCDCCRLGLTTITIDINGIRHLRKRKLRLHRRRNVNEIHRLWKGATTYQKVEGQWDKHLNLSDENYCSQGCSETWLLIFLTMIHKCCAHLIWKQYKCNTYLYNNNLTKILTRNKTPSGRLGLQSRHC